jgi:hypothetical protein
MFSKLSTAAGRKTVSHWIMLVWDHGPVPICLPPSQTRYNYHYTILGLELLTYFKDLKTEFVS